MLDVVNQIRGLGKILLISLMLLLEFTKLGHVNSTFAIPQSVKELHIVLKQPYLVQLPEPVLDPLQIQRSLCLTGLATIALYC